MSVTIKTADLKYKSSSTGNYVGVNAVAERTTEEMQAAVNAAGATQVTAVNNAGTQRLNAINTRATEVEASLPKSEEMEAMMAGTFDSTKAYTAGQYVIQSVNNVNKLYRFKEDHPAGAWIGTDAQEVKLANDVSDIKSAIELIVPEFDSTVAYDTDDIVRRGEKIYRRKERAAAPSAESWVAGHWTQIDSLAEEIPQKSNKETIALVYSPVNTYSKGDIMVKSNKLYKAKADVAAENWTAGHWELQGSVVDYIQTFAAEQEDVEEYAAGINAKSWSIKTERFENIVYDEKLFNGETLDPNDSAQLMVKDYNVRFQNNPYSIHIKTNTSGNTDVYITVNTFQLNGTQEFEVPIYVSDATNVTEMSFRTVSSGMVKSNDVPIITGWNKLRFFTNGSGFSIDVNTTKIRLIISHSTGTDIDIYIGAITQVKPNKGSLIIVADGPYYSFYTSAYPTLKTMGVPVTWALDPTSIGNEDPTGTRKLICMDELESLAIDGISEFSFHNFDGTVMVEATAQQALYDTLNNVRFLRKHGIAAEHIWRAAWLNNACGDPSLANLEVEASSSYTGASGVAVYPFRDRYNIPRYGLGGRTQANIDGIFTALEKQHCIQNVYLHGIGNADRETTAEMFNYFVTKLAAAITAGYVMPTTYSRMVNYFKPIK